MNPRCVSFLAAALLLAAAPAALSAYTYAEVLAIYKRSAGRLIHEPKLASAMRLLRDSRVLYLKSTNLPALVEQCERPDLLAAMAVLYRAGLLPHASTTADTIQLEKDVLRAASPAKKTQPIYRAGRVVEPIPFYEFIDYKEYYIFGGLLDPGTEFEVVHSAAGGTAFLTFEGRSAVHIAARHVTGLAEPAFRAVQDPARVTTRTRVGDAMFYRATHEYSPGKAASLGIVWVPLDRSLTVKPYVAEAYDRRRGGPTKVLPIEEISRASGAVAAVNGTFFINAPATAGHGKPLAPIVLDGQLAWSYTEPRVLKMNRAYLAITTDGRAVAGETALPAEEILKLDREGRFLPAAAAGARIRHLLGGFGWLVKEGDDRAWQRYTGSQFWYTYYSYNTKRPQTVMGIAADGRGLVLIAQEGMPHSSRPMSLPMLARYLKTNFPVRDAVFLDGGGSTQMTVSGRSVTRQEHNGAYRKNSTALLVVPRG